MAPAASEALVPLPADARCAVHSGVEAVAVCRRCGNYMCRACSRGGASPQCDSCRARGATDFPFSRERWTFSDLLAYCWTRFTAEWLMLSLTSLTFIVLIYGISFGVTFGSVALMMAVPEATEPEGAAPASVLRMSIQLGQLVLQTVLQLWLQLGFLSVALDVAEGREARIGKLFARIDRLPAAALQVLVVYAAILVFGGPSVAAYFLIPGADDTRGYIALALGALLAIPAIYLMIGCAFGMLQLVHDPRASALGALRTSLELVRGQRLVVVGNALVVAFIALAGGLACCVGVFPALGFGMLLYCSLFLALKTPTRQTVAGAALEASSQPEA